MCTKVSEAGYVEYSFVADMSTGFSGNLGYPIPENWAFDQFFEYLFDSSPSFDLDKVGVSGLDGGCQNFEEREEYDTEELLYEARVEYLKKCLQSTRFVNKIPSLEFNFSGGEYNLGVVNDLGITLSAKMKLATAIINHPDSAGTLTIEMEKGELSASFKSAVEEISNTIPDNRISQYI